MFMHASVSINYILRIKAVLAAKNRTKTLCALCFQSISVIYTGDNGVRKITKKRSGN